MKYKPLKYIVHYKRLDSESSIGDSEGPALLSFARVDSG